MIGFINLNTESDTVWKKQIYTLWDALDADAHETLASELGINLNGELEEGGRNVLSELLGDYSLRFLNLAQWNEEKESLLDSIGETPSLFLFDQDMTKNQGSESEGMKLIANILKGRSSELPIYCGLFTNLVTVENEHQRHTEFADSFQLTAERDRFAVISKQHIHNEPSALAVRLKRVAISPWCEKLKIQLVSAVKDAVEDAATKVSTFDIYDFEQIVF